MNNLLIIVLAASLPAHAADRASLSADILAGSEALQKRAAGLLPSLAPQDRVLAESHLQRMNALEGALRDCDEPRPCASISANLAREARESFGPKAGTFEEPLGRLDAEAAELAMASSGRSPKKAAVPLDSLKAVSDALSRTPSATAGTLDAYFDKGAGKEAAAPVFATSNHALSARSELSKRTGKTAEQKVPLPTLKQLTEVTPPSSIFDYVVDTEIETPASISARLATAALTPEKTEQAEPTQATDPKAKAPSRVRWDLQVFTGDSVDAPTPLTIHQSGQPDIHVGAADYYTSPWQQYAPYYAWRIGRWDGDDAWEFEHIHNKMFLANLPPDVQQFQLTHGYNYILLNRAHKAWGFIWRVGAGAIVTHPEIIVRNQSLSQDSGGIGGGYFLCGGGVQGAVEKRFYLNDHVYGSLEAKITAAYADVPIVNGDAQVPALTLHGLFGIGAEF